MKHIKTLVKGKACVTMVGVFDLVERKSKSESKEKVRKGIFKQ